MPNGRVTFTLLDRNGCTVVPVERWLEFGRANGWSPNTAKAYARALRLWWDWLGLIGRDWHEVGLEDIAGFVQWMRTGDTPHVVSLRPADGQAWRPATLRLRLAAVVSFYRYHALDAPVGTRLDSEVSARLATNEFRGMLAHIAARRPAVRNAIRVRREQQHSTPPVLLPNQIEVILDECAQWKDGRWVGDVRMRLLFETLSSSGTRIGESLGLLHGDWTTSRGDSPFITIVARDNHPRGVRQKSGGRKIYISDEADRLYKEHLFELCDLGLADVYPKVDQAPVFVVLQGATRLRALSADSVYDKLNAIKRRRPDIVPAAATPHWFRHTHATAALMAGVEPLIVSRRLGHANVETTLDSYGWVLDDAKLRELADWRKLAAAWGVELC